MHPKNELVPILTTESPMVNEVIELQLINIQSPTVVTPELITTVLI